MTFHTVFTTFLATFARLRCVLCFLATFAFEDFVAFCYLVAFHTHCPFIAFIFGMTFHTVFTTFLATFARLRCVLCFLATFAFEDFVPFCYLVAFHTHCPFIAFIFGMTFHTVFTTFPATFARLRCVLCFLATF